MILKTIKTEQEYDQLMAWLDDAFDREVPPSSPEGEQVQVALLLIKAYEDTNFAIPAPDPIDAIRLKMAEKGMRNKDFVGKLGSKSYVSAVLNGRKPLTLSMARFSTKSWVFPPMCFWLNPIRRLTDRWCYTVD